MARLASLTITVPANNRKRQPITGTYFFCKAADDPFELRIDGEETIPVDTNTEIVETRPWKVLEFINTTGADIDITFYYGDGTAKSNSVAISGTLDVDVQNASIDVNLNQNAQATPIYVKRSALNFVAERVAVSTSAATVISGSTITNNDTVLVKNIGSQIAWVYQNSAASASNGYPIYPGDTVPFDTQDTIYAVTATGTTTLAVARSY